MNRFTFKLATLGFATGTLACAGVFAGQPSKVAPPSQNQVATVDAEPINAVKASTKTMPKETLAKNEFKKGKTLFVVTGGNSGNGKQIEKAAKDAGVHYAHFNAKKGVLKVGGKNVNADGVIQSIEKEVPGVTAKKS